MSPTIATLQMAKQRITDIAGRFGVSNIRVFGSVARGTASKFSDVDLLVEMASGRSLLVLVGFEQE